MCIGLMAYGDVDATIVDSLVSWAMATGARLHDRFEVYFKTAQKMEQFKARNWLVEQAYRVGADFLIQIDDDQIISDEPHLIEKFYECGHPHQGALIMKRDGMDVTACMKFCEDGSLGFMTLDEIPAEPGPVTIVGSGCIWTDMTLYDRLRMPLFWPIPLGEECQVQVPFVPDPRFGLDVHFCLRLKEQLGIDPWVNPNITLGHMSHDRPIVRVPARGASRAAA